MQPRAIHDDMIRGAFDGDQPSGSQYPSGAGNFQTDEAVIVGASGESDWPVTALLHLYSSHYVLRIRTAISRPPHKRSDPCVARRGALALRWQSGVWGVRADDNPVIDVAVLCRKRKCAGKSSACLKLNHVTALRIVQSQLQAVTGID